MTTLRKLIKSVDKTNKELSSWVDLDNLASELNIQGYFIKEADRLKCYFIKTWYCTDTWVGTRAYFLDDEFICLSHQSARKADEEFSFISMKAAKKLRNYLLTLLEEEKTGLNVAIINKKEMDSNILPDRYTVEYNSQILHKTGFYKGERVNILKTRFPFDKDKSEDYFHSVIIELNKPKKKLKISCKELELEYNSLG